MFDLKRPCSNCPFAKGKGSLFRLQEERLEGIFEAPAFQCHKTVDYSEDEPGPGNKPNQCAGLMAVLHREERWSQIMRVAIATGHLKPDELDPRNEAYDSIEQVMAAHVEGTEP